MNRDASRLWRSLEEQAGDPAFREWLEREFPPLASEWTDEISRRNFLRLMAGSFALAGLTGCTRQPLEKIVPYVRQPAEMIPGRPLYFASAATLGGYARGIVVESHEGRPTKIEGNPSHPASLGATDVFMQAGILDLYDPDRSQTVLSRGGIATWESFLISMQRELAALPAEGKGLRILTQTVTSPTLAGQLQRVREKFPAAQWHQWQPINRDQSRAGAMLAFGEPVETLHHFDRAEVVLSLGADFLGPGPAQLRHTHDFAAGRRIASGADKINRLYALESLPTLTGAMADHRLSVGPNAIRQLAEALAIELKVLSGALESVYQSAFISTAAADLRGHPGASLVIAGEEEPAHLHHLAHLINAALGNIGKTVTYVAPAEPEPEIQLASLAELLRDADAGKVELLLILGGNPVFDAPADFEFARQLAKVRTRIHLGTHVNETAELCHWHLPAAHELESWSDARAFDGTASIIQPLIEPLYAGKTAHEILAALLGNAVPSSYESVRAHWQNHPGWEDFETGWRAALRDGVIPGSASAARDVTPRPARQSPRASVAQPIEILFRPDPSVYDGQFANNAWLQEMPKPITRLTWDNVAQISPETAQRWQLADGDVVELTSAGRSVRAPVFRVPGHSENTISLHTGYGRRSVGRVGRNVGFDPYALRTSENLWSASGVALRKTGSKQPLAVTQHHHSMEGRNIVERATWQAVQDNPELIQEAVKTPKQDETFYNFTAVAKGRYAWGMAIDLTTCTGCNACSMACVAENNIPVVGREEVIRGREMHWIRVDSYFAGDPENPAIVFQPVPCMHCELAPCELVCPVAATVHNHEGLNLQVYNRCIGTRYCSNNCPYKVRRFNFLAYTADQPPVRQLANNPNVTVRSRGVMEKCTYCVQRIESARIESGRENRSIRDGEVTPACAQACPAGAIVFGDLQDPESRVSRIKKSRLNYAMLAELNTRPRTTYLARITNPHPEMPS